MTAAIVVLTLCVEVLSNNWSCNPAPHAEPMTIEACIRLCAIQGEPVDRVEAWVCQCRAVAK